MITQFEYKGRTVEIRPGYIIAGAVHGYRYFLDGEQVASCQKVWEDEATAIKRAKRRIDAETPARPVQGSPGNS